MMMWVYLVCWHPDRLLDSWLWFPQSSCLGWFTLTLLFVKSDRIQIRWVDFRVLVHRGCQSLIVIRLFICKRKRFEWNLMKWNLQTSSVEHLFLFKDTDWKLMASAIGPLWFCSSICFTSSEDVRRRESTLRSPIWKRRARFRTQKLLVCLRFTADSEETMKRSSSDSKRKSFYRRLRFSFTFQMIVVKIIIMLQSSGDGWLGEDLLSSVGWSQIRSLSLSRSLSFKLKLLSCFLLLKVFFFSVQAARTKSFPSLCAQNIFIFTFLTHQDN